MAISPLAGLVDSNVFVDGYIPHGSEVSIEFITIISKVNEILAQTNTNVTDIATNTASIGSGFIIESLDTATASDIIHTPSMETNLYLVNGASGSLNIDLNDPELFDEGDTVHFYADISAGGSFSVTQRLSGGTVITNFTTWGSTDRMRKFICLPFLQGGIPGQKYWHDSEAGDVGVF